MDWDGEWTGSGLAAGKLEVILHENRFSRLFKYVDEAASLKSSLHFPSPVFHRFVEELLEPIGREESQWRTRKRHSDQHVLHIQR
jgi:hypothetical protein